MARAARAALSPVVPLAHAVVEPLAVVVETAHALVAGAAVLGASAPAGEGGGAQGGRLAFPRTSPPAWLGQRSRRQEDRNAGPSARYPPGTPSEPGNCDGERARPLVALRSRAPTGGLASEEPGDPEAGGGLGGITLSHYGIAHLCDGGMKRKGASFPSKDPCTKPGDDAGVGLGSRKEQGC